MDQGGSVSLVRNDTLINNPSDGSERAVGDFLYFTE
jgi:exopolysaccharide biosynthesis protein